MTPTLLTSVILAALAAAQPEPAEARPPGGGRLKLHAVEARTGRPLEGVSVFYQGSFDGKRRQATVVTGPTGEAVIEWAPGAKVAYLNLTATMPKLVPVYINWRGDKTDLALPAEKVLRFEPGVTIGGVVRDEAGGPVAGASVTVYAPPTESNQSNYVFQLGYPKTDAEGRWHLDEAPAELAEVWARAEHPEYREAGVKVSRDLDAVTVMTRGLSVSGVVTDGEGRPVKGAKAVVGADVWGSPEKPNDLTDEQGKFTIRNCEAGPTIVTVQAEGFAPQFLDAKIGDKATPLAFRLEPGAVLRVRLVDVKGVPVAGAFIGPDTWRSHRSIMDRKDTDAQGLYEWRSAPHDAVLYYAGKSGYMTQRHLSLTAAEGVQTVVLYPPLVASGGVTDAKTGEPLREFRVVQGQQFEGQDRAYWSQNEATAFRDGRYKVTFTEPSAALLLRVEAPGFKPADSRPLKNDEGSVTLDFKLDRVEMAAGVVLGTDGRPVAGVKVALATKDGRVDLQSGRFGRELNAPASTTDENGVFQFSPPGESFLLVAAGDAGFAEVWSEDFKKAGALIDLQPWGKVEGTVTLGGKPGANQTVTFLPQRPQRADGVWFYNYQYTTQTDADGGFAFDRVMPGPGTAARVVVTELGGGMSQHRYAWQEPADVLPGATAKVAIGGKGRPVVGRLVLDGPPGAVAAVDWLRNEPVSIDPPPPAVGPTVGPTSYAANIDKDGRFRIEDVPTGHYVLTVRANGPRGGRFGGPGGDLGQATVTLEVTGAPDTEPVDLGDVAVKVTKP